MQHNIDNGLDALVHILVIIVSVHFHLSEGIGNVIYSKIEPKSTAINITYSFWPTTGHYS